MSISSGFQRAQARPNSYGIFSDIGQFVSGAIAPPKPVASQYGTPKPIPQVSAVGNDADTAPGGYSGGYASGGGAASAAPANYDWMVDNEIGRLGGQQQTGLNNIYDSYNSAFANLTNSKTRANEDLDSTQQTTQNDNLFTRQRIGQGVRNNLTGLQRLLSAKGAGASSASKVLAPYAAGLQGNQQLQDVSRTYGTNMESIDKTRKRTLEDFENKFGELGADRTNKERSLLSSIAQQRLRLLAQKGDPNARAQIEALGREIDGLGNVAAFQPRQVDYSRPNLAKYDFRGTEGAYVDPGQAGSPASTPFWSLIGQQDKERQLA